MNLAKFLDFFSGGQADHDQPHVPFARAPQMPRSSFPGITRHDFAGSEIIEPRPLPLFSFDTDERLSNFGEISAFHSASSFDLGNGTFIEMGLK